MIERYLMALSIESLGEVAERLPMPSSYDLVGCYLVERSSLLGLWHRERCLGVAIGVRAGNWVCLAMDQSLALAAEHIRQAWLIYCERVNREELFGKVHDANDCEQTSL